MTNPTDFTAKPNDPVLRHTLPNGKEISILRSDDNSRVGISVTSAEGKQALFTVSTLEVRTGAHGIAQVQEPNRLTVKDEQGNFVLRATTAGANLAALEYAATLDRNTHGDTSTFTRPEDGKVVATITERELVGGASRTGTEGVPVTVKVELNMPQLSREIREEVGTAWANGSLDPQEAERFDAMVNQNLPKLHPSPVKQTQSM